MPPCTAAVYFMSRFYFVLISLIFNVVNLFKRKRAVRKPSDHLVMISATEAARKIARREITSQQLLYAYIRRIDQVNEVINAIAVFLFEDAVRRAAEIDKEIAQLNDAQLEEYTRSKPLLGVPFTVKDCIEVNGQIITCGVYSHKDHRCTRSAEVIRRMEAAGAILIAITNVPEACFLMEACNGIYGRTKNPYDFRRAVVGSSGGEGALMGAAGSVIGVGSDIAGSIRIPAFMNGIFGLKPTPGIIPLDGHIPTAKGFQDQMLCIGPLCRYIEDIPLMMEVMGGRRALDLRLRDEVDFSKIRFFYMEGVQHTATVQYLSCEMRAALLKAVSYFEEKFDVEAICLDLPLLTKTIEMSFASMQAEGSPKISEIFMSLKGDRGTLNWVRELPKVLSGKSVHTPGALLFAFIESTDRTHEQEKAEYLHLRDRLSRQISELLGDDGILLFPSWPITAPYHHQGIFAPFDFAYTCIFNALTVPAIQCPLGLNTKGLPLGVQIVSSHNFERLLVAAAQQLSNAFGGWTPVWKRDIAI